MGTRLRLTSYARPAAFGLAGCIFAGLVPGCTSDASSEVAADAVALRIGDEGPEVRAIHDYLMRFGYFPNDQLAAEDHTWRPVLRDRPARPDLFDQQLARGVEALQRTAGLPVTGEVDAETRAMLRQPRCRVPERGRSQGEKFALEQDYFWNGPNCPGTIVNGKREVTYSIQNLSTSAWNALNLGFTQSAYQQALRNAMWQWSVRTSFSFKALTTGGCIRIYAPDGNGWGPGEAAGTTPKATSAGRLNYWNMNFNKSVAWSVNQGSVPSNKTDLVSVAEHELGHALMLWHTSVDNVKTGARSIMFPFYPGGNQYTLSPDDLIAARLSRHVKTSTIAGQTHHAIAADSGPDNTLWILDANQHRFNGYGIRATNGSWWTDVDGEGIDIAVDGLGRPWHVNEAGEVYVRQGTDGFGSIPSGRWMKVGSPAPLSKIAAGGWGSDAEEVYALGKNIARAPSDKRIYRFNRNNFRFDEVSGFGTSITVDRWGDCWHTNQYNEIYVGDGINWSRFDEYTTGTGRWVRIRSGKDATLFAIDDDLGMYVLNRQNTVPDSEFTPELRFWNGFLNLTDTQSYPRDVFTTIESNIYMIGAPPGTPDLLENLF